MTTLPAARRARPFDVCGDLPTGLTVLEASAGTGKTFTIAALAARYVAAGTPLHHLLLVTFTRMATGELRERVRERLVAAHDGLVLAERAAPLPDDDVVRLLAEGSRGEVAVRRRRLGDALAQFDAATIATIHGFCQHMLDGMGVAGDVERDVAFVEDLGDLVEEVVDDLYVRRFALHRDDPPFDRAEALRLVRVAVAHPRAPLQPADAPKGSPDGLRVGLARLARAEVERRKRRERVITYDDLLLRLASTLRDREAGPAAKERLRRRYRVVLVDEFQDTDPVQWEILEGAFGGGGTALVLIGDPKQAIYAFRGADVHAYLAAARTATERADLAVNWRSDQALVDAYDAVFRGATLGHERIAYLPVRAADAHQAPRVVGAPQPHALRLRVLHRGDVAEADRTGSGAVQVDAARALVAEDLASDVVELLNSAAQVLERADDGTESARTPVRPDHVAVLVRRHVDAARIRDALDAVGVPAVINGAGSVFATPVARDWLRLLEALERPAVPVLARGAALTPFIGWSVEQVAAADDAAWEDVHATLHRWAAVLRRGGVAALLELATRAGRLPGRILARIDGDRLLTDLRHVGQLLHVEATSARLGATALTAWLRQRIAEADDDTGAEDRSRRLESDADAVQVLTIHRSKGLEFPVVYCPYLWDPPKLDDRRVIPVFHDGDERTIDLARDVQGRANADSWRRFVDEQRGEELRLAYVALTRARHCAVVWWVPSYDAPASPLGRLLFGREPDGSVSRRPPPLPDDDVAVARLQLLAARAGGAVGVERIAVPPPVRRWMPRADEAVDLDVRAFTRSLDRTWRRTSYTDLTRAAHDAVPTAHPAHDALVASEPEASADGDERGADGAVPVAVAVARGDGADAEHRLRAVASPLAVMARGAEVGSFVHAVLEASDWSATDLDAELRVGLARARQQHAVDPGDDDAVVAGLRAAVETPLGPIVGDRRLRDVGRGDRVDELWFELPLVGGERPSARLALDAVAALLRRELPPDDALSGYADRLDASALDADLRGFLTGSIDAVLRVRDGGRQRFAVVDHKTNWLAPDGEDLSAWHHRPAALVEAMERAHYPLQALLYCVALHRYLRWRHAGYDPQRNLAGVLYLFVRGMVGADTPRVDGQPCGVFAWHPPARLVVALSDLLDRGSAP